MLKKVVILILQIILCAEGYAGWVIVEVTRGDMFDSPVESTLYIRNNIIRSDNPDHSFIIDLNTWQLTYISPRHKGYWTGPPSRYTDFMQVRILEYIEKEINAAEEYDKAYLQAIYDDLKFDLEQKEDAVTFIGEGHVEIVMTDETDRILGYPVNQFIVYADRFKVEEIWVTRELTLNDQYDYELFRSFVDEMSLGGMIQDYRSSDRYIHVMRSGFPMITLETGADGLLSKTEVVSIHNEDINDQVFSPPPHYKRMSLDDLGIELGW